MTYPQTPEALVALLKLHPDPVGYVGWLVTQLTPKSISEGYEKYMLPPTCPTEGAPLIEPTLRGIYALIGKDAGQPRRATIREKAFLARSRGASLDTSYRVAWVMSHLAGAAADPSCLLDHQFVLLAGAALLFLPKEQL